MPSDRPDQPNVIVFFTDQQRADICGCYGNPMNITPHLDVMARRGTRLENSITVQPVCGPARSCLQTGRYATQTGVWKNNTFFDPSQRTLAHHFNEAGYRTGYIGKWHLYKEEDRTDRLKHVPREHQGGYQDWYAANVLEFFSQPYDFKVQDRDGGVVQRGGYRVDAQTDLVLEYIREVAADERPFFLFASYIEPHHQNEMKAFVGPEGSKARFKDPFVPEDLRSAEGDWPKELPDYYGCCASLDDGLGRVRSELERLGLDDKTIVMFTSDHGCHFRTRNQEYKRSCHESSLRVPTVIQGPGFDGGGVVPEIVSLVDWSATLLDAAGISVPESMEGRSILPLLGEKGAGARKEWSNEAFVQISESHIGRALRTPRWKYSVRAPDDHVDGQGASDLYVEDFLYDLQADPFEQTNLVAAPERESVRLELRGRLLKRMQEIGEPEARIVPSSAE